MGTVNDKLELIAGYFATLKRDTTNGWYLLEIGLPLNWVFKSNDVIDCEIVSENKHGKLIIIKPKEKSKDVTADDLLEFAELIKKTNIEIVNREKSFTEKMDKVKKGLEDEINLFYVELENLREESFSVFNSISDIKKTTETKIDKPKRGRPFKKKDDEK